jgi:ribose-phosphate pyrophosphokinase
MEDVYVNKQPYDNIGLWVTESNYFHNYTAGFFPGGEPHVEIEDPMSLRLKDVEIIARVGSSEDFMMMLALTHAVRQIVPSRLTLVLPYFPGARQDRLEHGFAFTAKMYADLINAQRYDEVFVLDPHSHVTPAIIRNVSVIDHKPLVEEFLLSNGLKSRLQGIICPDAGAEKRTSDLAAYLKCDTIVPARKKRDPMTGALSGFSLEALPSEGLYLMADDICDGGGTFIGLANEYRKDPLGTGPLILWTTHGIFSKGYDELVKHFYQIGCSDSFPSYVKGYHSQVSRLGINY